MPNIPFAPPADDGNPAHLKGREPLQGAVVAVILAVVAVLDLTVTKGAGAPKHPTVWTAVVGLVLAVGLVVSLRYRSRIVSPFVAIFGAFFVTLSASPRSLSLPHLVALIGAVGFAVSVSLRQRREQRALATGPSGGNRRAAADARRRRRKGEPEPPPEIKRPAPSGRYTPPKAKTPPKR